MIGPWVIRRTDQGGGYVARPGSAKSYTRRRDQAQRFPTYAQADASRCEGNEVIEPLNKES